MNQGAKSEVPVVVVGTGPAGLMTCFLLSRYGVRSLLVERNTDVSPFPRAMGINARTMEIFRGLGLAADVEAVSVDVGDCPFQVELETLRGPVLETVRRGGATHTCGVTARLRQASTKAEHLVRAAWLVAADGAHSTVRSQLGIEMRGRDHISRELNILFDADLWDLLGDVRAILYDVRHPRLPAPCLFRNVDGSRCWSLLTPWFDDPSPMRCREVIRLCAGDPQLDVEIIFGCRRVGAGHAAGGPVPPGPRLHGRRCCPPRHAGRRFRDEHRDPDCPQPGLEAGRGATGLGWARAARHLRGERRPWACQTVELSFRLNGQHRRAASQTLGHVLGSAYETGAFVPDGTPPPLVADRVSNYVESARPGRRAPHVWLTRQGLQVSTIDLFDGGFVLLSRSEAWCTAGRQVGAELSVPLTSEIVEEPAWAETYGVGQKGAVLVRPDGHVAWRRAGPAANPPGELGSALAAVLDLRDRAVTGTASAALAG